MGPRPVGEHRRVSSELTPDGDVGVPLSPFSVECTEVLAPEVEATKEHLQLVDYEELSMVSSIISR
jgi:hypothetical protein